MSKLHMGSVMMIMLVGLMFSSGTSWVSAENPKEGLIVQGNQLKAMPGYVLEKRANNQMTARRRAGAGPLGGTATCGCEGGTGTCNESASGPIAVCNNSPSHPCNGTCKWELGPPTKVGPSMR